MSQFTHAFIALWLLTLLVCVQTHTNDTIELKVEIAGIKNQLNALKKKHDQAQKKHRKVILELKKLTSKQIEEAHKEEEKMILLAMKKIRTEHQEQVGELKNKTNKQILHVQKLDKKKMEVKLDNIRKKHSDEIAAITKQLKDLVIDLSKKEKTMQEKIKTMVKGQNISAKEIVELQKKQKSEEKEIADLKQQQGKIDKQMKLNKKDADNNLKKTGKEITELKKKAIDAIAYKKSSSAKLKKQSQLWIEIAANITKQVDNIEKQTNTQIKAVKVKEAKEIGKLTLKLAKITVQSQKDKLTLKHLTKKISQLKCLLSPNICGQCTCLDDRRRREKYYCDCQGLPPKRDCKAFLAAGHKVSGFYKIHNNVGNPMQVYCDQITDNGGWVVFQRRVEGSVDFHRNWNMYKNGFGSPTRDFWIGNDNLHLLTGNGTELRIDMRDWNNKAIYAEYSTFHVESESNKYRLHVTGFSGDAGDSFSYNNAQYFSSKDKDNDDWSGDCSNDRQGAWWFKSCSYSNLNGEYRALATKQPGPWRGVLWHGYKGNTYSMKSVEMKVRRTDCSLLASNLCGQCTCQDDHMRAEKYYCDCRSLPAQSDCKAYRAAGSKINGLYKIQNVGKSMQVYCDQTTDNGGWLVFQRRMDGSIDFYRDWKMYKNGFGSPTREVWIGNDNLHLLTGKGAELRIDMRDWKGKRIYAKYGRFQIENEANKYRLNVKGFTGNYGDNLSYNNRQQFSTKDSDNDAWEQHCSAHRRGAWWYRSCSYSNLNGEYRALAAKQPGPWRGVIWAGYKGQSYPMKSVEMKLRIKECSLLSHSCGQCTCHDDDKRPEKYHCDCRSLAVKSDCKAHLKDGHKANGLYRINNNGGKQMQVYCDQTTDNGGWVVFQRRMDGSVDFYRNWNMYKNGFGSATGEFWIGNDNLHLLTGKVAELRIDMRDWNNKAINAKYSKFQVGDEKNKYRLHVKGFSGKYGDNFSYNNLQQFSTNDKDNDVWAGNCSKNRRGAWWYRSCSYSNLNGEYRALGTKQPGPWRGVIWHGYKGHTYSMKSVEMKLRI